MIEPELYEESNILQKNDGRNMCRNFGHLIQWKGYNDTIMDIGCGPGDLLLEVVEQILPKRYSKVIGLDVSKEMIDYAQENFKEVPYLEFVRCDFSKVDSIEEPLPMIDHIFSNYTFHWLKDQRKCFNDLYNLLNPGGDLLVSILCDHPNFAPLKLLASSEEFLPYFNCQDLAGLSPYHGRINPEDDIYNLAKEIGFKNIKVECLNQIHKIGSLSELKQFLRSVNPPIALMSPILEEKCFVEFTEWFKKLGYITYNGEEIFINLPYKYCILYCQK